MSPITTVAYRENGMPYTEISTSKVIHVKHAAMSPLQSSLTAKWVYIQREYVFTESILFSQMVTFKSNVMF
jgi:hypothetical protein